MRYLNKNAGKPFSGWLSLMTLLLLFGLAPAWAQAPDDKPAPLLPWGATPDDIPEGYMIIEGDIQVPIGFDQINMPWATNFWPNGVVPYEFDANVTAANRTAMLNAMAEWTAVANVTFRVRTNEADYVHIQNSDRNNSAVGRQGGQQIINIVSWDSRFRMAHELAHTLGFFHEQSRTDRDTFVQINWTNIQTGQEGNFAIENGSGRYGPYDFDSVMHYGQCDFSTACPPGFTCACPAGTETITVLPPDEGWYLFSVGLEFVDELNRREVSEALREQFRRRGWALTPPIRVEVEQAGSRWRIFDANTSFSVRNEDRTLNVYESWQSHIGQRDHLSRMDGLIMGFIYSFGNWRFVDRNYTGVELGTFRQPYRDFLRGVDNTPDRGTLWVQPGVYSARRTYSRPMTWQAPLGGVTLN